MPKVQLRPAHHAVSGTKHSHLCSEKHASTLPAGFKAFELLDKEVLQNFGTLVEGWVAGVIVAAIVEDFGHVCYKLSQLDVLAPL